MMLTALVIALIMIYFLSQSLTGALARQVAVGRKRAVATALLTTRLGRTS